MTLHEALFDEYIDDSLSIYYWFDEEFYYPSSVFIPDTSDYRKIVERKSLTSQRQDDIRLWGYSPVTYKNRPTILNPGDVINMPYKRNQTSAMQALGNAWSTVSGLR